MGTKSVNTSFNLTITDLLEEDSDSDVVDVDVMIEGGLRTSLIGSEENSSYGTFQSDSQDLNSKVSLLFSNIILSIIRRWAGSTSFGLFWASLQIFGLTSLSGSEMCRCCRKGLALHSLIELLITICNMESNRLSAYQYLIQMQAQPFGGRVWIWRGALGHRYSCA